MKSVKTYLHYRTPQHRFDVGRCPDCGKYRYASAKIARKARRNNHLDGLHPYRCGDYWHLGHVPENVTRGYITRSEIYDQ